MRTKRIKYICKKDCYLYNFFDDFLDKEAKCFKDIFYYISYDSFTAEYEVYSEEDNDKSYIGTFETDYFSTPVIGKFEEYFVTLAQWRDKQIENILND
jgi:hypothetical protein